MKRSPMPVRKAPLKRSELRRTPPLVSGTSGGAAPAGGKAFPGPASRLRASRTHRVPVDVRRIVNSRSGGFCELFFAGCYQCADEMHHRISQKLGGRHRTGADRSDRASNLLHICTWCHLLVTNEPAMAYERGWALRERQESTAEPLLYRGEWVYLDDAGGVHLRASA